MKARLVLLAAVMMVSNSVLAVSSAIVNEKVPDWVCRLSNDKGDQTYISTFQVMTSATRSGDMWTLHSKSSVGSYTMRINQTNGKGSITDNSDGFRLNAVCLAKRKG